MFTQKANLNVKIDAEVKELAAQVLEIIKRKNIPNIVLEADENGDAYIDKEQYPELYDWAVNG